MPIKVKENMRGAPRDLPHPKPVNERRVPESILSSFFLVICSFMLNNIEVCEQNNLWSQ